MVNFSRVDSNSYCYLCTKHVSILDSVPLSPGVKCHKMRNPFEQSFSPRNLYFMVKNLVLVGILRLAYYTTLQLVSQNIATKKTYIYLNFCVVTRVFDETVDKLSNHTIADNVNYITNLDLDVHITACDTISYYRYKI